MYVDENKNEALPGFEPRSLESESNALTNYAITPLHDHRHVCSPTWDSNPESRDP